MVTTSARIVERENERERQNRLTMIRYSLGNALIVTRREVQDSFRDWRIIAPIVILTFFFPFLSQFIASEFQAFVQDYGADLIGERTIPFLLMVVGFFPISISLVIALETFVGEKERRSLEPLLSTPLTNTELYIGKTLAAMIPPLVASFGGMAVYLSSLLFGELSWRPPLMLIVQIILLTTFQALVMVTGAVVVSSQANSTRAANLLASFIIIPMALVVIGESIIMFLAPDAESPNGIGALWAIIAGMLVIAVLFLRVGNSIFNREELLSSTLDQLNLRGILAKIGRYVVTVDAEGTPARNLFDWYRRAIPFSLGQIKISIWIMIGAFVVAMLIGVVLSQTPRWQLPLPAQSELVGGNTTTAEQVVALAVPENVISVGFIFSQNMRVLLLTLLLGTFSFGVAALVIPPLTFLVLGYVGGLILGAGYDPLLLITGIMTHGFIEIPVITIAAASALALGSVVTRPAKGMTVGHAWTTMLGSVIKIWLGLVIPGLIIAAVIEATLTPRLVISILTG
ncbi:MAG: stage II sporulation protein M [Chloroflexota bacterium]